jgi:hypothetical protein
MAFHARTEIFSRPTAIAIHDDGDMPGQLFEIDLL